MFLFSNLFLSLKMKVNESSNIFILIMLKSCIGSLNNENEVSTSIQSESQNFIEEQTYAKNNMSMFQNIKNKMNTLIRYISCRKKPSTIRLNDVAINDGTQSNENYLEQAITDIEYNNMIIEIIEPLFYLFDFCNNNHKQTNNDSLPNNYSNFSEMLHNILDKMELFLRDAKPLFNQNYKFNNPIDYIKNLSNKITNYKISISSDIKLPEAINFINLDFTHIKVLLEKIDTIFAYNDKTWQIALKSEPIEHIPETSSYLKEIEPIIFNFFYCKYYTYIYAAYNNLCETISSCENRREDSEEITIKKYSINFLRNFIKIYHLIFDVINESKAAIQLINKLFEKRNIIFNHNKNDISQFMSDEKVQSKVKDAIIHFIFDTTNHESINEQSSLCEASKIQEYTSQLNLWEKNLALTQSKENEKFLNLQ